MCLIWDISHVTQGSCLSKRFWNRLRYRIPILNGPAVACRKGDSQVPRIFPGTLMGYEARLGVRNEPWNVLSQDTGIWLASFSTCSSHWTGRDLNSDVSMSPHWPVVWGTQLIQQYSRLATLHGELRCTNEACKFGVQIAIDGAFHSDATKTEVGHSKTGLCGTSSNRTWLRTATCQFEHSSGKYGIAVALFPELGQQKTGIPTFIASGHLRNI